MAQAKIDFEPINDKIDFEPIDFEPIKEPIQEVKVNMGENKPSPVPDTREPKSTFRDAWDTVSSPLTHAFSRFSEDAAKFYEQHPSQWTSPDLVRGAGSLADEMTSPVNLASLPLGGPLEKAGFSTLAKGAGYLNKAASAGMVGAGAEDTFNGKYIAGPLEMLGGALGLRSPKLGKIAEVSPEDIKVAEEVIPKVKPKFLAVGNKRIDLNSGKTFTLDEMGKVVPEATGLTPAIKTTSPILPRDLQGAKPRFNVGSNSYQPQFESDVDKAAFILAQKNPSKRDADYLKFVMEHTGLDESGAKELGRKVKAGVKEQLRGQELGVINISTIHKLESPELPNLENPQSQFTPNPSISPMFNRATKSGKPIETGMTGDIQGKKKYPVISDAPKEQPIIQPEQVLNQEAITEADKLAQDIKISKGPKLKDDFTPEPRLPKTPIGPNNPPFDQVPTKVPRQVLKNRPNEDPGKLQQTWDLARGLMSVDLPFVTSMGFRQANSQIGTKAWFEAWGRQAYAYGSKTTADAMEMARNERPYFKRNLVEGKEFPSVAERLGLRLGDLTKYSTRDEVIKSGWAEKIPGYGKHIIRNNRAANEFSNHISSTIFESLMDDAFKMGKNPIENETLGRAIATVANDSVKRGALAIELGKKTISLEQNARLLSNVMFSPRGNATNIRMLNPSTYITADPIVRQQYIGNALRTMGAWMTFATAAKFAGADIVLDPNSADFGKIKFGPIRLDPAGGIQQFLVFLNQMKPRHTGLEGLKTNTGIPAIDLPTNLLFSGGGGVTNTNTKEFVPFGEGYKPETRAGRLGSFARQRVHPSADYVLDLAGATKKDPVGLFDRTIQLAFPMMVNDMEGIAKQNLELAPLIALLTSAGMSSQEYKKGDKFNHSVLIPNSSDIMVGK